MDKKDFGNKIKEFRKNKGLTQFELAEAIDIHEKHLSKIESGLYFPSYETLVKIMHILNMEWRDFDYDNKSDNPYKNKILKIINKAKNKNLKIYAAVLETLQKTL